MFHGVPRMHLVIQCSLTAFTRWHVYTRAVQQWLRIWHHITAYHYKSASFIAFRIAMLPVSMILAGIGQHKASQHKHDANGN
jgi:hypothetical protein